MREVTAQISLAGGAPPVTLDLHADPAALTAAVVDVPSVSGDERVLADAMETALRREPHLEVVRSGEAVLARTRLGPPRRVLLAGHLDTVPIADNVPSRREGDVPLRLRHQRHEGGRRDDGPPRRDPRRARARRDPGPLRLRGGRGRAQRPRAHRARARDWLDADLAILGEPTSGQVEAGCQGTLRVVVDRSTGRRAHSARSWLGDNAIHAAAPMLGRLAAYEARSVDIDGCVYREGLQAVRIDGGVAGNVVPDGCTVPSTSASRPTAD